MYFLFANVRSSEHRDTKVILVGSSKPIVLYGFSPLFRGNSAYFLNRKGIGILTTCWCWVVVYFVGYIPADALNALLWSNKYSQSRLPNAATKVPIKFRHVWLNFNWGFSFSDFVLCVFLLKRIISRFHISGAS